MKKRNLSIYFYFLCGFASLISAQAGRSQTSDVKPPEIRGSVIYSDKIEGTNTKAHATGMYSISPKGEFSLLLPKVESNGGGLLLDGLYYSGKKGAGAGGQNVTYTVYDPLTWKTVGSKFTLPMNFIATDLAFDLSTGKVFGCFMTGQNSFELGTVNFDKQRRTKIADLGARWFAALGVSADGILYGIDNKGYLYKINKNTGDLKSIGFTGYEYKNTSGGAFDPVSGKFYCSFNPPDQSGFVCEVDLTTGKGVKVHDFQYNDELVGLYIPAPSPFAKAPGKAADIVLSFPKGSMSGSVSFTLPSLLADSTQASGTLNYIVTANGKTVADGVSAYGAKITKNITLEQKGDYRFRVICSNTAGKGEFSQAKMFVGKDAPEIPRNVTASFSEGKFTVKWDDVINSFNDGYIDPSQVRYKVIRMPEGKVVASDLSATEFSDNLGIPEYFEKYYYKVTASYEELESPAGESPKTPLGNIHAPWKETFDKEDGLLGFTILDADKDKKTFTYFASQKNLRAIANTTKPKDDWVFTPPVFLEKNKSYRFSFEAKCQTAKYKEKVEAKIGRLPDVKAMTGSIVDTTELNTVTPLEFGDYFTISETGVYYIGIHACSDMKQSNLYIDTFSLEKGKDSNTPGAPTEMKAVPDFNGGDSCRISFKAPAFTSIGDELNRIDKIELMRDSIVLTTFYNPEPGILLGFTDNNVSLGRHSYTATAFNNVGPGIPATVSAMIGVNVSAEPLDLKVTDDAGKVKLEWKAPDKDVDGNPMNPDFITYMVTLTEGSATDTVFTGLKTTQTEFTPVKTGEQKYIEFKVQAVTLAGTSAPASSGMMAIGSPYRIPYYESFAETKYTTAIMTDVTNGAVWRYYRNGTLANVNSPDVDNGYADLQGVRLGDDGSLYLGKIDLKDTKKPQLSFRTFNCSGKGIDENEIEVFVDAGSGWESLGNTTVNKAAGTVSAGWCKISRSLEKYVGKVVRIKFTGRTENYPNTMLDCISVSESADDNIALRGLNLPIACDPSENFEISLVYENTGTKQAAGYVMELYHNGKLSQRIAGPTIESGKFAIAKFTSKLSPVDGADHEYYMKVNFDADSFAGDNVSEKKSLKLRIKSYPEVSALSGKEETGKGIRLNWMAPDCDVAGETVTEDFELWDSWTHNVGDWSFVDGDNTPVGGLGGYPTPLKEKTLQSFYVFDFNYWTVNKNKTFKSYSGHKHLANMYCWNDSPVNDWMISPELSGKAQKVSFMARRYATAYLETFEFLTSASDNPVDTAAFKRMDRVSPEKEWTKYEYDIPAGTKYFAIRCLTQGGMMLFVDDVTYNPGYSNLKFTGYNIYRDGKLLTASPVSATEFYDNEAPQGEHIYSVTAVYASGESGAQNVIVKGSGVELIENDPELVIKSCNGYLDIFGIGGNNISIYNASGIAVGHFRNKDSLHLELTAGVYLVCTGSRTHKVLVK